MLLENFYQNNKNQLISKLASYSGDQEAAKDAVQEAFLKALANRQLVCQMPERSIWSWLYTTAKNSLIDEKRKTARLINYDGYEDYEEVDPAGDYTTTIMVKQLLPHLPEHLVHVVSLRYYGNLNSTEIGKLIGIPAATVRTQLRAAIAILKKYV